MESNKDCKSCGYAARFNDGGGDYEEIVWHCTKLNEEVTYTSTTNKPCGLSDGEYYITHFSINSDKMLSQADVRNKLSPFKNLIAMINNGLLKGTVEVHPYIQKEIEQCKISISYLSGENN